MAKLRSRSAPGYDDMPVHGREMGKTAPRRMLWAADRRHVTEPAKPAARARSTRAPTSP
jgi:hypothetical protein